MSRLLVCSLLFLAGCVSAEEIAAYNRSQCLGLGFTEATDGYRNCLLTLELDRRARRRQASSDLYNETSRELMRQEIDSRDRFNSIMNQTSPWR